MNESGTGIIAPITLAGTKRMYSWELDSVGNWLTTESKDTADVTTAQNRTHNKLHQIINGETAILPIDLRNRVVSAYDATYPDTDGANDMPTSSEVSEDGSTIKIAGNAWKKMVYNTVISTDTVLTFEFKAEVLGEAHSIGFDSDDDCDNQKRQFYLGGTQDVTSSPIFDVTYKMTNLPNDWVKFTIPVGQHYTGNMKYMCFISDDDASGASISYFRNIYVYDTTLAFAASSEFDYDGNGNLVADGEKTYTWDAMNRLLMVSSGATTLGEYRYDANGRRIRKTAGETTTDYIYSGMRCLEERVNDSMTKQFVWGLYVDELLQIKLADDSKYYPLQDLLYRTNILTDSNRNIVESYDCDAYGNTLVFDASGDPKTSNIICEYIFTGRQLDPETGLYFYRARYYSPELGRFISKDPINYVDGMGLYEYCKNIPIILLDPNGDVSVIIIVGILVLIGAWTYFTIAQGNEYSKHKMRDPNSTEKNNLWWSWRLLKECGWTTYMADAIKGDLFFSEINITEDDLKLDGKSVLALTIEYKASFGTNREIILRHSQVSDAATKSYERLELASTLWHEYHHWKQSGSDSGAYYQEIVLTTKLWQCWCEGNEYIRANVKPRDLASIATEAARNGGHQIPEWVKQAKSIK